MLPARLRSNTLDTILIVAGVLAGFSLITWFVRKYLSDQARNPQVYPTSFEGITSEVKRFNEFPLHGRKPSEQKQPLLPFTTNFAQELKRRKQLAPVSPEEAAAAFAEFFERAPNRIEMTLSTHIYCSQNLGTFKVHVYKNRKEITVTQDGNSDRVTEFYLRENRLVGDPLGSMTKIEIFPTRIIFRESLFMVSEL